MRWQMGRRSTNVEDRRGSRIPLLAGGGIGGLVLLIVALIFGVDPRALMQSAPENQASPQQTSTESRPADPMADFVSVVLADTEDTWSQIFSDQLGRTYDPPKLVLFSGATRSACGLAESATGPFYCPSDQAVYIDLEFYRELKDRFGAPGDFAQAYVIAHEVGHHVQSLLGRAQDVHQAEARSNQREANALSVRLELQADCYAGVWGHSASERNVLEQGDLEEALNAASAIGDDRLERGTGREVTPDSFTHGSSTQRTFWFRRGFETGDIGQCETFEAASLGD
ncbi:MAG: neutral zinc metallopeptidase [Thermoanaerobaculia bacterium]